MLISCDNELCVHALVLNSNLTVYLPTCNVTLSVRTIFRFAWLSAVLLNDLILFRNQTNNAN